MSEIPTGQARVGTQDDIATVYLGSEGTPIAECYSPQVAAEIVRRWNAYEQKEEKNAMKAACMNAVPDPKAPTGNLKGYAWIRCGYAGEVSDLGDECPRCLNAGRLAPVIEIPLPERGRTTGDRGEERT